jgi:hypothetical protein
VKRKDISALFAAGLEGACAAQATGCIAIIAAQARHIKFRILRLHINIKVPLYLLLLLLLIRIITATHNPGE